MKFNRILQGLIILTFLASLLGPLTAAYAQPRSQGKTAQAILESMSYRERVGQLFLVTFSGTNINSDSQIYDLIVNHHIGGVMLSAANDNFVAAPDTITEAHNLINGLQTIEWDTSEQGTNPQSPRSVYVPLLVGISQEGDGPPNDQILNGLTPLPDAMAIGATWNTDLSQQVGTVLGDELSRLGFNLLLGPSLDVVESPNPSTPSDMGTRVFGGNPFWVGEMGRAYIKGLHQGSNGHMVVVAKHFPGRGDSDRLPEQEVATVRKSLDQLKQTELPPFVAVTNTDNTTAEQADGLLIANIRYEGFQGNIRATTRPVSLDASALPAILAMPEFMPWRTNGGLLVSGDLGSNAVHDFYSQGTENFSPRLVARDAFLAGNDLLNLGNITGDSSGSDTYSATLEILDFFAQEYLNDSVFAQKVDAAVLRILQKKLDMYSLFDVSNVRTPDTGLLKLDTSQQVTFDVARNAATLVSPDSQELSTLLPAPPGRGDRMVFITDTSTFQQCSTCAPQTGLSVDAIQSNVERLYGQSGSAQIFNNRLSSYSLAELVAMLNGESETNIESALTNATWIVIALEDVKGDQLSSLRRFFSERPNLMRNKNVILFSFTAPYYLDATDISKLTAYYALYSKQPAFVDMAARLLFQPVPLQGFSPVSILAVGYDLNTQTSPEPTQIIPLLLDTEKTSETPTAAVTVTPEPTEIPSYQIGDSIAVRAGPILDRNGHIVPDGTMAQFTMSTRDETGAILSQVKSPTVDGIARANFVIDNPGSVEIHVISGMAITSGVLQFTATSEGVAVTVVVPAITPTATEMIVPTATATVVENGLLTPDGYPRVGVWWLALLALFGSAGLAFWAASKIFSERWGLRWALCMVIGGLLGYNYLALGFPGATNWIANEAGTGGVLILIFTGETIGGIAAWVWMRWFSGSKRRED